MLNYAGKLLEEFDKLKTNVHLGEKDLSEKLILSTLDVPITTEHYNASYNKNLNELSHIRYSRVS